MSDDKRLERIEAKLDDVSDHIAAIDVTLGQQHVSLREHIRRTAILESEIQPIKRHVQIIEGFFKIVGAIVLFLGAVATIFEVARMYFKV